MPSKQNDQSNASVPPTSHKAGGPSTPEGKARSSQNARTHGLSAADNSATTNTTAAQLRAEIADQLASGHTDATNPVLLPHESPTYFDLTFQNLIDALSPRNPAELAIVEMIAQCDHRYNRAVAAETQLLLQHGDELFTTHQAALAHLSEMEQQDRILALTLAQTRGLDHLLRIQNSCLRQKKQHLDTLAKLRRDFPNPVPAQGPISSWQPQAPPIQEISIDETPSPDSPVQAVPIHEATEPTTPKPPPLPTKPQRNPTPKLTNPTATVPTASATEKPLKPRLFRRRSPQILQTQASNPNHFNNLRHKRVQIFR